MSGIARCTKCNVRLAVFDADGIPLCPECFEEEMPDCNRSLTSETDQQEGGDD